MLVSKFSKLIKSKPAQQIKEEYMLGKHGTLTDKQLEKVCELSGTGRGGCASEYNSKNRLQKEKWLVMKDQLKPIKYLTNKNGKVKGFYKDKEGNIYTHLLSDEEIKDFITSLKGSDK